MERFDLEADNRKSGYRTDFGHPGKRCFSGWFCFQGRGSSGTLDAGRFNCDLYRGRMKALFRLLLLCLIGIPCLGTTFAAEKPNIVYIMSDELAYFELGHMGNDKVRTPHIDRMAKEGIRFTRAHAASPVCAPLRCNLMTGKHAGHASVRANDGGTPLRADEVTIAALLKDRGYATGGFGKWGAGGRGSTGVPEKHGFDEFFGY